MRNWVSVEKIPDTAFVELVQRRLPSSQPSRPDLKGCFVYGETSGSFNVVKFIRFNGRHIIVKVPKWGTQWTKDRAYLLRSEVETMKLIFEKTDGKFPIPLVLDHDDSQHNEICAPYVIMEQMPGCSALAVWFDHDRDDGTWLYSLKSDTDKRALRERFLWSLAQKMSMLQHIQFDQIGMLTLDEKGNRVIGDHIRIDPDTEEVTRRSPMNSTQEFYLPKLNGTHSLEQQTNETKGLSKFFHYIFESDPFSASLEVGQLDSVESFVLAHPDLNAQNCFCDPITGEVTAILDWEGAHFVPRCVGYASVPLFLRADWCFSYTFLPPPKDGFQNLPVEALEHYRARYAQAMRASMDGDGDCVYTPKSHIYNAVHTSLYPDINLFNGYQRDIVSKVLHEVMKYEDPRWVMERLGAGELDEQHLQRRIREFLGARKRPRVCSKNRRDSAVEILEGLNLQ